MTHHIPLPETIQTAAALALSQVVFLAAQRLALQSDRYKYAVIYARALGGLILCAVPLFNASFSLSLFASRFILFTNAGLTLLCALFFSAIALYMTFRLAGRPDNLKNYPQLRISGWTTSLLFFNCLSWLVYLAGYEIILRGFLFFSSMQSLSLGYAILLNLVLYSLAHIHKGPRETIGSIPFGLLLCVLTAMTGNIWNAFIIHSTIALGNEIFSIKANPGMFFV